MTAISIYILIRKILADAAPCYTCYKCIHVEYRVHTCTIHDVNVHSMGKDDLQTVQTTSRRTQMEA